MHNRSQHHRKNGQYKGRQHTQMLDDHRRAQENKRSDRYRPKSMHHVTVGGATWTGLLMLLIICPAVVAETRVLDFVVPEMKIHNQPVARLPANAVCQSKGEGTTEGKVCHVAGKTYFLKSFPLRAAKTAASAKPTKSTIVVQEEFNRQLMKKAGVNVPQTQFFKQLDNTGKHQFYIGTEKIVGIKFGNKWMVSDKELGGKGVARLAVASTLIADLHHHNYGWNADGLILVDTDGVNMIPVTMDKYVEIAEYAFENNVPPLSLFNLRQMVKIYEELLSAGLPEFHEQFSLTQEKYSALLNIFIKTCQLTMEKIRRDYPNFSSSRNDISINKEWNNQLRSVHPQVISQHAFGRSSL